MTLNVKGSTRQGLTGMHEPIRAGADAVAECRHMPTPIESTRRRPGSSSVLLNAVTGVTHMGGR
jgi:hypothetical protein